MERSQHEKTGAAQGLTVVVKETFGHHRTHRSKSSDDSSSLRPPLERSSDLGKRGSQSYLLEGEKKEGSQTYDEEGPQDLSKQGGHVSRESSTESVGNQDMQYVLLDDDDDDDDEFEPSETMDSSAEGSAAGLAGSNTGYLLKCSMCDRVFSSQQRLMLHVNKHMGAKPYACPQCPANFNSRASFQRHRRSHKNSVADIQTHTCNLCHAQFSNIQHLTEHLKIHTEKRRSCPHCGIFIGGSRSLQKHISMEHPSMVKTYKKHRPPDIPGRATLLTGNPKSLSLSAPEASKPVCCRLCGRQFQTNRALQGHMKGHSRLYQWNPRRCKCGILLADEAEYQRHLKNSCCSSPASVDMLPPPMDSPGSLSPVSPSNVSHFMALSAQKQATVRSRSLDSFLRNPSIPITFVSNYPMNPEAGVGALSPSVVARAAETHAFTQSHDENSSISRETVSSLNNSEQSIQSPVEKLTIKTEVEEEWSEVVDVVRVGSNAATSEEPSGDRTLIGSELGSRQPARFAYNREEEAAAQERMMEDQASTSLQSGRSSERDGQPRQISQSFPSGMEATSSNRTMSADGQSEPLRRLTSPRISVPHQEDPSSGLDSVSPAARANTESPNTQITSSQTSHPTPHPLVNPSLLGERDQDGLPWRCAYCGITFEDSLMYVIHKGCHEPGSMFRCSMCGEQCADKVTFMLHFVRGQHTKPTHV